ncbi:nuclear transport factor 2 family protein [uncultured Serinicoccus sp.]|uniref:nuclear transport factor 2 family protein n=1 Tax=uncultured Serinicoccus sp. TaxID=735514 RepID=UPI002608749A|nr:nuclear transport factor 2 family protein [uncultured Serinicoccus sp.]
MTTDHEPTPVRRLPDLLRSYLAARDAGRYADAAALFAPDAVVEDDGGRHVGIDAVARWIVESATAVEHTTTVLGHTVVDDRTVDVLVRIEGPFLGGSATLRQRFTTDYGVIRHLTIEPAPDGGLRPGPPGPAPA